jgi:hypothetical protein
MECTRAPRGRHVGEGHDMAYCSCPREKPSTVALNAYRQITGRMILDWKHGDPGNRALVKAACARNILGRLGTEHSLGQRKRERERERALLGTTVHNGGARAAPAHGLRITTRFPASPPTMVEYNILHGEDFPRTVMRGSSDGAVEPVCHFFFGPRSPSRLLYIAVHESWE